ncbi:hypothetical protein CWI36_0702p0010 [Hamiltosporidium magnivora]|uniref:Uncharacterized protein n=1 Tax=Hamiltosporidium magnivora TaxID=148818 RepID=A0A4Q9LAP7_9MICR|nr:hypothetical protein CWI36_0702p0010 [Hamiltosporidium magnivora]
MIKLFNEAFGKNTYYLFGNYNLYIIDTIGSVLYEEDTLIRKTTLKTAMKQYIISFGFSCDPALYEYIIMSYPLRNFEFKSFSHNTEFHYFLSLKNKKDYDYKFKILLKHSYITFEFNFNWCNAEQTVNKWKPKSFFYLCVTNKNDYEMIEIVRKSDPRYFILKNVSSNTKYFLDFCLSYDNRKIEYLIKPMTLRIF